PRKRMGPPIASLGLKGPISTRGVGILRAPYDGCCQSPNRLRLRLKDESGNTKTYRDAGGNGNRLAAGTVSEWRPECGGRTRLRKGVARDEARKVLSASWNRRQPVQRGRCANGYGLQAALPGNHPPSGVEQVLWQPGGSVHGTGLRGEGQ